MADRFDYSRVVGQRPYRPFSRFLPVDLHESMYSKNGPVIRTGISYDPLSEGIDTQWAGQSSDGQKFNNYYDYYFGGEDIKVYIDGLFDPEFELDISSFQFGIKQEKQPLYGFWSYNYDAMMYGTRIVSGTFSVFSRYPGRMRELLTKAAEQRVLFNSDKPGAARIQSFLTGNDPESVEDEKNLKKYWNRSNLDRLSADSDNSDNRNIFSSHPPFNFIIKYGTQEGSLSTVTRNKGTGSDDNFDALDRMMATDYNERLAKPLRPNVEMDIVLQDVNLLSMTTGYMSGGQAVVENYEFLARDMYVSSGNIRGKLNSVLSDVDSTGATTTDSTAASAPLTPEELAQLKNQAG